MEKRRLGSVRPASDHQRRSQLCTSRKDATFAHRPTPGPPCRVSGRRTVPPRPLLALTRAVVCPALRAVVLRFPGGDPPARAAGHSKRAGSGRAGTWAGKRGIPLTPVAGDPRAPADLCFVHGRCLCPAAPAVGVSPSRCERCLLPSGGRTAWRPPTSPGPAVRRHPARYGRP